jgi:signal transduction histidine kinase/ligand-binding sensor domain-containing protein
VRVVFFNLRKPVWGILLVGFVSFLACAASASTNSAWFARNWQSDKGLPNNTVFGLAQTPDGYLWLGTSVGLVAFDGNRFQRYAFTNSLYKGNRGVLALVRGRNGGLWAGMDRGGVVYLDGDRTKMFTQTDGMADGQVQAVTEDGQGTLWVVYLGDAFRQIKDGKVNTLVPLQDLPADGFNAMTCDKDGNLWWAVSGRAWIHKDDKFLPMVQATGGIRAMCAAGKGGVWIADSRLHLFHCDTSGQALDNGKITPAQNDDTPLTLHEDATGAVWIGMASGALIRYDGSKFEIASVLHPQIQILMEDREGNIWAGTQGGGLYKICRRVIEVMGVESGLPAETLSTLCADGKGGLWAVMANGLLAHRTDGNWQVVTNKDWAGEFLVCANVDRDGTLWLGSRARKLHRWRDGDAIPTAFPSAPSSIQALLCGSDGNLWIGGLNYLERLHDGKLQGFSVPGEAHSIRAIAEDSKGGIWAGSSRGILLHIEDDQAVPVPIPDLGTASSIRCLLPTADGSIWIGHAGLGVSRIKNGHYSHIGTEQGLFDDYISQIIPDDRGWLWFGADRGIFKVRQEQLEAAMEGRADRVSSILFEQDEGAANLQAVFGRSPETARSGDGRVWISTHSGVAAIDPELMNQNAAQPQVVLEKVILDGRVMAQYKNILPTWEEPGHETMDLRDPQKELSLPPDCRRLEIEFTTLSFVSLENIRFRYRLAPLDQDWLGSGLQRYASYSRLPAGHYHFEAQVCTSEGVWYSSGPVLTFKVLPYFWQTWWFITAMVVLMLGTVGGSVRYFEKRRLQRQLAQLERERAVERERARIAKDIHDDLGASLTRITMLSQSAMNKAEPVKPPTAELSRIYDTARSMTNAMDEIVWAINPSHDTLESLAAYFAEFVQEFLTPAGLPFRLEMPLTLPRWNISSEVRHNLYLAFKEALNNVVKHSRATEVVVALEVRTSGFVLSVEDNGCGFNGAAGNGREPVSKRYGNGLVNMRRRLEELHGQCVIVSQPGRGTRVAFEVELKT